MKKILMADLNGPHERIIGDIMLKINNIIESSQFINGNEVLTFKEKLQNFLNIKYVVPCANGSDALQIALLSLNIERGSEVIVPSFNYVSSAESVALLGYKPVFVDVEPDTFNISLEHLKKVISPRTRAVIAVHLFGQCANMEEICQLANAENLFVIEDVAQSLGSKILFKDGKSIQAGTMGDIGITSFFPTKNLGCMGDGGALFTDNEELASKASMIASHGQNKKYYYKYIGMNSRLDTLQAAILNVKLEYLEQYIDARRKNAFLYNKFLVNQKQISIPVEKDYTYHTYNQYTIQVSASQRGLVLDSLKQNEIPYQIYYPLPLHLQEAFKFLNYKIGELPFSEKLSDRVISLPMHTELEEDQINYICEHLVNSLSDYK